MSKKSKRLESRSINIEEATEFLKERIYATITLLALLATLWHSADHFTAKGVIVSIVGTVIGLWLAIGIASRMSYQVVHGKRMDTKTYFTILRHHSALLAPAFPVVIFILGSLTGLYSLKAALLASLIVLLLSFVGFSLLAGRRMRSSWTEITITSGFEIALGIGVIALKIYAGH
ncbi:MAG TPA: hypothetical protein VGE34_00770 [Candidatus Saccharimonadales bacterium]